MKGDLRERPPLSRGGRSSPAGEGRAVGGRAVVDVTYLCSVYDAHWYTVQLWLEADQNSVTGLGEVTPVCDAREHTAAVTVSYLNTVNRFTPGKAAVASNLDLWTHASAGTLGRFIRGLGVDTRTLTLRA
ncbi:hypothetical protein [Streptomyces sp. NPDC088258]|uniref:hypothetical protein n=1 Tax=Streptomyces sp. NPDC088258 TaxID=3365849 RepID=UPI00380800D7